MQSKVKNRILLIFLALVSCVPHSQKSEEHFRRPVMGTFFEVTWMERDPLNEEISKKMFELVQLVDEKVSTYKSKSDLSVLNFNAGKKQWVPIHPITKELLDKSMYFQHSTEGYFNISVGALVHLWKLNLPLQGETLELPSDRQIEKTLLVVKNTKIEINKLEARIIPEGALLDMGGIAKGYALDLAYSITPKDNCGFMNLGRQMMVIGSCPVPLRFGIQNPKDPAKILAVVELSNGSIATTGSYERYFVSNGKKYGHVLSAKNGKPVQSDIASVTVWASDGTSADAWSTTLYIAGMDEGMKMIRDQKIDIGVLWILKNNELVYQDSSFGRADVTKQIN